MATEQKTNKQQLLPSTDEILLNVWCRMNGWDEIITDKLKELKISTISTLKSNSYLLSKAIESIQWNKCSKPKCICGAELIAIEAQKCYPDNPDSDAIICDGCDEEKEKTDIVYHCKCGKTTTHEDGYDLCSQCTVINTKEYFINQLNQLKAEKKVEVKYADVEMAYSYGRHSGARGGGYSRKKSHFLKALRSRVRSTGITGSKNMCNDTQLQKKIGFSVGGAKDVNSFRDNILKNNRIPQLNSITFEGIYYDYYFQTKETKMDMCDNKEEDLALFYPSYVYSKSYIPNALLMSQSNHITNKANDMIAVDDEDYIFDFHLDESTKSDNSEYFLNISLNSNINEEDFSRKNLNLICVLDVSGSMSASFACGYGNSKMKTANQCILSMLTHLTHKDRFGLCLFNRSGWEQIKFKTMKRHKLNDLTSIMDCYADGGTNFEAGWNCGMKMFEDALNNESVIDSLDHYENRIVFLTDACPNIGHTNPNSLMRMVEKKANATENNKRVYTTFIGVGLDFNANLISEISKVRGANYFAVHSESEFYKKLILEFDYFVSPMVFDLKLVLQSEGGRVCIDSVYGSNSNDIDTVTGEIMSVNTLFPSPPNDYGDVKGGIILIKLKKNNDKLNNNLFIECTFQDKHGQKFKNKQMVNLTSKSNDDVEYYPNAATRKGILLTRYVILMKEWIKKFGQGGNINKTSAEWKEILKRFRYYFTNEMKVCNDKTLEQEVKILTKIINQLKANDENPSI